jgi:hypothetical protein
MPKVSKDSAAIQEDHGAVVACSEDVAGHTIDFVTFNADVDATPLLAGLPGNRCGCPHWGYVIRGRMTFAFDDHDEVFEAGDAFHVAGGHTPRADAGTEYVQFSPAGELRVVSDTIRRNMEAMRANA